MGKVWNSLHFNGYNGLELRYECKFKNNSTKHDITLTELIIFN